jgi:hypothetical protein
LTRRALLHGVSKLVKELTVGGRKHQSADSGYEKEAAYCNTKKILASIEEQKISLRSEQLPVSQERTWSAEICHGLYKHTI